MNKIKLGLIYGGKSAEHEVSLMSVQSVLEVINHELYDITQLYITKEGHWTVFEGDLKTLEENPLILSGRPITQEVLEALYAVDVLFPVIHGPHGEDGSLQGLFESLEIPYVGSKVLGSAVCMDKIISKKILKQVGLEAVQFYELYESLTKDKLNCLKLWAEQVGYPVFVKPSNMGSSVGISKVCDENSLEDAVELALKYDKRVLIEEGIVAREIECAVLESDGLIVSGVGEVIATSDFYDYEAKYTDDGEEKMRVPAKGISTEIEEEIRAIAKEAFLEHGCNGLARVDFFLEKGTNRIILNEINTLPGMTMFSMYPALFEAKGITYTKLIDCLIKNAIDHA